jgi:3'-phosphoadenosine 5'-phosphosulfate sulfotransferase
VEAVRFSGPYTLHKHLTDNPEYDLFFDWDESFGDRGLTITKIFETGDEPGAAIYLSMTREQAEELFQYLYGCINYRPRPSE